MSENLIVLIRKEEIIQLISGLVEESEAPTHETINHLTDIVAACTKGVDDLTAQELARLTK